MAGAAGVFSFNIIGPPCLPRFGTMAWGLFHSNRDIVVQGGRGAPCFTYLLRWSYPGKRHRETEGNILSNSEDFARFYLDIAF